MTIRNINQYIRHICRKASPEDFALDKLGTNEEPLLQKIYGEDPNPGQVKAVISEAASFATNAEEQLFYEFVQNAYDANADSLYFFANENYLLVLNNGEPFYTDFDLFEKGNRARGGQLYSFIAKGKSAKRNDPTKLGKFGQGSKLLYTLLTNVSKSEDSESPLIDAIYERKGGPYLISWYNQAQLASLLLKQPQWTLGQGDDYENNLLFCKILMSYYPLAPGVDENLFSIQEALDAIDAFDTLVDPRSNWSYMNRGTALIIPLGEGKYKKITSKENLEKVRTRLAGFAAITKSKENNKGRDVEHIYVMGQEVEQHKVCSLSVDFDIEDKSFSYLFAFNPKFAEKNCVNLFKGLPIIDTKLCLGFLIDSQNFEVDNSRQRISDKEKTQGWLTKAFLELVKKLRELKETKPKDFDYIYKAIVATTYQDGEDFKYIQDAFKEVFVPFLKEFVRTSTGEYERMENVRSFAEDYSIPLSEIGVTKYKWIDKNIAEDLSRHGVGVEKIGFSTLISDTDQEKRAAWIKSLPQKEYSEFFTLCDNHKDDDGVSTRKLFRTNKGNLFSYQELTDGCVNVYSPYEPGMRFGECEHIDEVLSYKSISTYLSTLFSKIKANIEYFRASDSTKEDAANLLAWIESKDANYTSRIRKEIMLLPNWHGTYASFENLMAERPEGTILFDNYKVKGYNPTAVKEHGWLLNPATEGKQCWKWTVSHWENLKSEKYWGGNTHNCIADVKKVYNAALPLSDGETKQIDLYLNEDGKPTAQPCSVVCHIEKLQEDEYYYLQERLDYLHLLPYRFFNELNEAPFHVGELKPSDIINGSFEADEELLCILLKIIDDYVDNYRTQEIGERYIITKIGSGQHNYVDIVADELSEELANAGFYHIPDKVQEMLNVNSSKYRFTSDNGNLLISAIKCIDNPIVLLPLVKAANAYNAISGFFQYLKPIHIDSKLTKESLEWQLIELAVQRTDTYGNDYTNKVFSHITHDEAQLPSSITRQYVIVGKNKYDTYILDENYKNCNQAIESFLQCLPSEKEATFFKKHYYKGKVEEIPARELFDKLKRQYLSIEQLRFCIDYAIENNDNCNDLEITEGVSLTEALDMILKNEFKGFDKHFKMEGVDLNVQVYAPQELLLQEECLPASLHKWIDDNTNSASLFSKLATSRTPYIAVRESLLNDNAYDIKSSNLDKTGRDRIERTINWALEKGFVYEYKSDRYKVMMSLIGKLPSDYVPMPLLRYTGEAVNTQNMNNAPTFLLEECQDGASFLSESELERQQLRDRLQSSTKLKEFIKSEVIYVNDNYDLLSKHNLYKQPRLTVLTTVEDKEYAEYDDDVYRKWKNSPDSRGITIHTSREAITTNFCIMSSDNRIFEEKLDDGEFGYETGKRVVIQQPNEEGLSLLKTIAKHISDMPFFNEPFIKLQSLYVEELERMQEEGKGKPIIDLTECDLSEEAAQDTLNRITQDTANSLEEVNSITSQTTKEQLKMLNESIAPLISLATGLTKDEIERIAKNKEKLITLGDSELTKEEAQDAINKITKDTASSLEEINSIASQTTKEQLQVLNESIKPLVSLATSLTKEEIERLAECKDILMVLLDDYQKYGRPRRPIDIRPGGQYGGLSPEEIEAALREAKEHVINYYRHQKGYTFDDELLKADTYSELKGIYGPDGKMLTLVVHSYKGPQYKDFKLNDYDQQLLRKKGAILWVNTSHGLKCIPQHALPVRSITIPVSGEPRTQQAYARALASVAEECHVEVEYALGNSMPDAGYENHCLYKDPKGEVGQCINSIKELCEEAIPPIARLFNCKESTPLTKQETPKQGESMAPLYVMADMASPKKDIRKEYKTDNIGDID